MKQQHFLLGSILKLWLQKMCSIDWLEHWTIFGQINFKYSSAFKVFNLMFKNVQRSLRQIFCQKIYILTPSWAHEMKMYKQTKKLNKWPKKTVNAVIISEFYLMNLKYLFNFIVYATIFQLINKSMMLYHSDCFIYQLAN